MVGKLLVCIFFCFFRLIICVAMDVVYALPSHARGNIIFRDGVTFYRLPTGNSNFSSFCRRWHRKIILSKIRHALKNPISLYLQH